MLQTMLRCIGRNSRNAYPTHGKCNKRCIDRAIHDLMVENIINEIDVSLMIHKLIAEQMGNAVNNARKLLSDI